MANTIKHFSCRKMAEHWVGNNWKDRQATLEQHLSSTNHLNSIDLLLINVTDREGMPKVNT